MIPITMTNTTATTAAPANFNQNVFIVRPPFNSKENDEKLMARASLSS
jgi:hypothetical protein